MRQRTPSGVKWVANELAAIVGELERIDEELARLTVRRAVLSEHRTSLNQMGAIMGVSELQAAAPHAVDMRTLVVLAQDQFKLDLVNSEARDQFRKNTLGRAVRKLYALGLVERLHQPDSALGPGL